MHSAGSVLDVHLQSVQDIAHGVQNIHTKADCFHGNVRAETVMVTFTGLAFMIGGGSLPAPKGRLGL